VKLYERGDKLPSLSSFSWQRLEGMRLWFLEVKGSEEKERKKERKEKRKTDRGNLDQEMKEE